MGERGGDHGVELELTQNLITELKRETAEV